MPWYGSVLLAVIPAAVVGLLMWLTARSQNRGSIERLEKELANERDKDRRQWVREVRSEPLLAFRGESARMAQKYIALIRAAQMQHTRVGLSDEEARNIEQDAVADWNLYVKSGDYERAMCELDHKDIVESAQQLWGKLADAHVETTSATRVLFKGLEDIRASITAVQELINRRLQEL